MTENNDEEGLTSEPDNDAIMFTAVEREILIDLLENGDNVPQNISNNIDRHRTGISDRLRELQDDGWVESKGSGVWTLTSDGVHAAHVVRRESLR